MNFIIISKKIDNDTYEGLYSWTIGGDLHCIMLCYAMLYYAMLCYNVSSFGTNESVCSDLKQKKEKT